MTTDTEVMGTEAADAKLERKDIFLSANSCPLIGSVTVTITSIWSPLLGGGGEEGGPEVVSCGNDGIGGGEGGSDGDGVELI